MIARDWAASPLKLDRAASRVGENASDYELQREYISLGGKVIGELLEAPKITEAPKAPEIKVSNNDVKAPVKTVKAKAAKPKK